MKVIRWIEGINLTMDDLPTAELWENYIIESTIRLLNDLGFEAEFKFEFDYNGASSGFIYIWIKLDNYKIKLLFHRHYIVKYSIREIFRKLTSPIFVEALDELDKRIKLKKFLK